MAILKIARMGHPVLMGTAQPVQDPTDRRIHGLVADMVETMADAPGIGLAAPQVHVPLRVVVFRVPGERTEDKKEVPLTVLVNPVIELVGDATEEGWEGCLSLPEMTGRVPRHTHIRYRAHGLNGKSFEREAKGYHARVVQHECDHLDGILYPMRMTELSTFGFVEEMARASRTAMDPAADDANEDGEAA
ncbi:MAG: peptide deformylase [Rhodospirillales bacterium CG15_BIG_FIL_POST_REV_8_21_14_020_66_15]|nr:MAG: peptide deformylase [Rhodospirillales bacterium CG15_BIG_FIL_POST_REV_8_21_14_020_66_15]